MYNIICTVEVKLLSCLCGVGTTVWCEMGGGDGDGDVIYLFFVTNIYYDKC